ncbi:hypothetical protein GCM10010528_29030 [Gordonia defluvii]|uniref:Uncharacterized protein n=1 Tax=Gordonia defluvii TaxID=283718 RepID=A0ABP6LP30_9ACTN
MGDDGILDGEFVQIENRGDRRHLGIVGGVQAEPHESFPGRPDVAQGLGVGAGGGVTNPVDVDGAINYRINGHACRY